MTNYYWIEKEDGTLLESGRKIDQDRFGRLHYTDIGRPHLRPFKALAQRLCKPGEKAVKVQLVKVDEGDT